jgi:hypothetical protein
MRYDDEIGLQVRNEEFVALVSLTPGQAERSPPYWRGPAGGADR